MPVHDPSSALRPLPGPSRAQRLKTGTDHAHRRLDQRILDLDIFRSRAAYACFLRVQHRLHADVHGLYACPALVQLLPSIQGRQRLSRVACDLADLDAHLPDPAPCAPDIGTPSHGLGWLYVMEGSALGGAVLLKLASQLGLHANFGARHMAPAPEGVAAAWRRFVAELDAIVLDPQQEAAVLQGAGAAFARAAHHLDAELG